MFDSDFFFVKNYIGNVTNSWMAKKHMSPSIYSNMGRNLRFSLQFGAIPSAIKHRRASWQPAGAGYNGRRWRQTEVDDMGRHVQKRAKLTFIACHYDPYIQGNTGHNGVRRNSTWPVSICGDPYMGRHINKWAKLNFVARHYGPYVEGHKGHNGVRQKSTWPISICCDPYIPVQERT